MTTIDGRVLLSASLNESFFRQQIFVAVNNMFDTDTTIHLAVFVPGETEDMHTKLRDELCGYLRKALVSVDKDWVFGVEVEKSLTAQEDEVVVTINDPSLMAYGSEELVLQAVRPFVTVRAKRMYRRLTILSANQLLVPLNFEYTGILNELVMLQLPAEMQLMGSFTRKISADMTESDGRACSLVEETLMAMLQAFGLTWRFLRLVAYRNGVQLEAGFDGANPPKPYQLNLFEDVVAQVLGAYCRYSNSVYGELMFQPVDRHSAELDDGGEPPE